MEALRPDERGGRAALAPDWIGEDAAAVDLDERGGVADPRRAQAGSRRCSVVGGGAPLDGNILFRNALLRAEKLMAHHPPERAGNEHVRRNRISELAVSELRRVPRAFEALAGEPPAERREPPRGNCCRHGEPSDRDERRHQQPSPARARHERPIARAPATRRVCRNLRSSRSGEARQSGRSHRKNCRWVQPRTSHSHQWAE